MLNNPKKSEIRKIAIILTGPYPQGAGVFQGFKNIVKKFALGSKLAGENVELVACVLRGHYNLDLDFQDFLDCGVSLREFDWRIMGRGCISNIMELTKNNIVNLNYSEYVLADDQINYLFDCDFWFLVSDRTPKALAPLRPYAVMAYDHIQRYIPSILSLEHDAMPYLYTVRSANFVFSTMPFTLSSVIQYAGADPERVFISPLDVDLYLDQPVGISVETNAPYFVWSTNLASHKNQLNALKALIEYYSIHNGMFQVVMTGAGTEIWDVHAEISSKDPRLSHDFPRTIREMIQKNVFLRDKLIIAGELSRSDYIATLSNAKFFWHPTLIDAGTFCCLEAAAYGVPTLSHDYPPMRFLDEKYVLNMAFFNARNPREAAKALKDMELQYTEHAKLLPSLEQLQQHSCEKLAPAFWAQFKELVRKLV